MTKRTWRRALRRLVKDKFRNHAAAWPHVYQDLTLAEFTDYFRAMWLAVGPQLKGLPKRLTYRLPTDPSRATYYQQQWICW